MVRSEAIPERRHNSGGTLGQNSFYSAASSEEARMAGERSSNAANRANYRRVTRENEIRQQENEIGKGKVKVVHILLWKKHHPIILFLYKESSEREKYRVCTACMHCPAELKLLLQPNHDQSLVKF